MAGAKASETKRLLTANGSNVKPMAPTCAESSESASTDQGLLEATNNLIKATNKGSKGKRPAEDEAGERPLSSSLLLSSLELSDTKVYEPLKSHAC